MQRWNAEEIAALKENYGRSSLAEIAHLLGRTKNSVAAKVKSLKLNRPDLDRAEHEPEEEKEDASRLDRLLALRERMEEAIAADVIPYMQQPAYYREYRALLADIEELERDDGNGDEGEGGPSFADALAGLVALQREILDRAGQT